MGAEQKRIARRFFPAFVLGDVAIAAEALAPEVELMVHGPRPDPSETASGETDVYHGLAELEEAMDIPQEDEKRTLQKWKMKQVQPDVIRFTAARWTSDLPEGDEWPSIIADVELELTFRDNEIVRVEMDYVEISKQ